MDPPPPPPPPPYPDTTAGAAPSPAPPAPAHAPGYVQDGYAAQQQYHQYHGTWGREPGPAYPGHPPHAYGHYPGHQHPGYHYQQPHYHGPDPAYGHGAPRPSYQAAASVYAPPPSVPAALPRPPQPPSQPPHPPHPPESYNAVPPPPTLAPQRSIPPARPAWQPPAAPAAGPRPAPQESAATASLVSAAQSAAAAIAAAHPGKSAGAGWGAPAPAPAQPPAGGRGPPASVRPAFLRVNVTRRPAAGAAPAPGQGAWPPSLKAYVERAFTATPAKARPRLQLALKSIIAEAQAQGELWRRDWDTLPLPDMQHSAEDAAVLVRETAAFAPQSTDGALSHAAPAAAALRSAAGDSRVAGTFAAPWLPPANPPGAGQAASPAVQGMKRGLPWQTGEQAGAGAPPPSPAVFGLAAGGRPKKGRKAAARSPAKLCTESEESGAEGRGPWRRKAGRRAAVPGGEEEVRARARAGRFGSGAADGVASRPNVGHERRQRFLASLDRANTQEELDWDAFAVKGTCTRLEKSYFRLTSAPDPATVRSEPVLRAALDQLVARIASGQAAYFYALDQFKGLRQDCTVQHLRNGLARQVYEAHARAALEYGDVAEYNQCQGQLAMLDAADAAAASGGGRGGGAARPKGTGAAAPARADGTATPIPTPAHRPEFLAYRILYQAVHARHGEGLALLRTLGTLRPEDAAAPAVRHALAARAALAAGDAPRFAALRARAPGLGAALMDLAVPGLRYDALCAACKAFKPGVAGRDLARMLGFVRRPEMGEGAGGEGGGGAEPQSDPLPGCSAARYVGEHEAQDEERGLASCLAWLEECGAVTGVDVEGAVFLDCKASSGRLARPADKEAVAHGDANLDIGDFMKGMGM
ncbi:hypothetical protein ACKKBG_A32260 [Auxenochlorella protothecoides x Auxenochlorella symbiontica]